jgi:hypothetical protein
LLHVVGVGLRWLRKKGDSRLMYLGSGWGHFFITWYLLVLEEFRCPNWQKFNE